MLARCYEEGDGVVQDFDEAVKYAEKVVATYGLFIERELMRDSMRVLVRCMKRGHVQAQIVLGNFYADEYSWFGSELDNLRHVARLKAAHCYRKAAAQGSEVAADKLRKVLEGK